MIEKHFPGGSIALVVGGSGAIGAAMAERLRRLDWFKDVLVVSRKSVPPVDITDEKSVVDLVSAVRGVEGELRLVFDASGFLSNDAVKPEKSILSVDTKALLEGLKVNAIGPLLLLKHLYPLFPLEGKSVFASLSARVGSISDNSLGGWYSYRGSKAALNQYIKTASIEIGRRRPSCSCVVLHPGTVQSKLSAPFLKSNLNVISPEIAAERLAEVILELDSSDTGSFFDNRKERIEW